MGFSSTSMGDHSKCWYVLTWEKLTVDDVDNIQKFIDMGNFEEEYGQVLPEAEFLAFCKYPQEQFTFT